MPVNVIGTLKPKNNGKFPVAEAVDIKVTDDLRLDKALEKKADLSSVNFALENKADKTTALNLQAQIEQIVISSSAESVVAPEVAAARVNSDGKSFATLKERLDYEETNFKEFRKNVANEVTLQYENGYFISAQGTKTENADFMISEPFYVESGIKIIFKVKGYQTNIAVLSKTDSEES
ncbi:MAG TPA: hypothetical protein PLS20_13660, partial [Ruminococcus flavefaciens]|nr:hypothetical protein [Ruminococcus flavefaciens]